jgi:class 3 adenylate cyclase/tetratricopeptide (TPR) repeat protein
MTCKACGGKTAQTDRFCASCGAALGSGAGHRESRKTVSIVFLDIVGSTALAERLDPEPLRQIMDRYFATCAASVTAHGGVVEKFIGDAVLAVFGATVAHEDDAVQAVKTAADSLDRLGELNAELAASYQVKLEARCGICTGEVVVVTTPGGDFRVVGDAVNTASRLQTAAGPGEILLSADTATMVRSQVGIESVAALALKGKAQPVPAWRVTSPDLADADRPAHAAPFIGRADELEELRQTVRRVKRRQQTCMVTVLGVPGIGKSRLVQEFLAAVPAEEATVLSGRCSAYGRGITYAPLAEMLGSFPGGWTALAQMLGEDSLTVRTLETIMAEPTAGSAGSVGVEDIAWAFRHLLDLLGRTRPVIMVWEDLHWAEETLLDLIDNTATWLDDVPVLLLCVARTELLESRPTWGGGQPCAMTVELGPLTYEQCTTLVSELAMDGDVYPQGYDDIYSHVAGQCDGNPLFAELILDVFAETAPSARIPPTIAALLSARLDQLPCRERTLLELAAMIGRDFSRDALLAMAGAEGMGGAEADELTDRLVRRRVLRRGSSGTFRFTQALLRDIAYGRTSKSDRERLHEFLAQWLSGQGKDGINVAYHVEAAYQLRKELRPGDSGLLRLAAEAAGALIAAGMSALARKDLPAAVQLLERGRELLPPGDARHTVIALHICDSGIVLRDDKRPLAALAAAEAALAGDHRNAATCAIQRGIVALRLGLAPPERVEKEAGRLTAALENDAGDHLSWCRLHQLQAYLHLVAERAALADASLRLALARARALADEYEQERLLSAVCELAQWAPTHVRDGLSLCAELSNRFAADRTLLVPVLVARAHLSVLAGDIDGARRSLAAARACAGDLHLDLADAAVMQMFGFVESLAGAHDKSEAHYRQSLAVLRAAQHAPDTQATEVTIARELFDQGRTAAAALALDGIEADDEVTSHRARIVAAALRSRIASARGRHDEAVVLARKAQTLSDGTDDLCLAGQTLADLAAVLRAAGRPAEASAAGTDAVRKFEAKGATLLAERIRAWLPGQGPEDSDE